MVLLKLGVRLDRIWDFALLCLCLAGLTVGLSSVANAQGVPGYFRTHWSAADAAPPNIRAIVQSADGYLWLGSSRGLYRFDGITFTQVAPDTFDAARSQQINTLAAAPDGTVWAGYRTGGVARYSNGHLAKVDVPGLHGNVVRIIVGRKGEIFIAASDASGNQIHKFENGRWSMLPVDQSKNSLITIYQDRQGTLWSVQFFSMFKYVGGRGPPQAVPMEFNQVSAFAEGRDNSLWLVNGWSLKELTAQGSVERIEAHDVAGGTRGGQHGLLVDDDGMIWIAGEAGGLIRVPERGDDKIPRVSPDVDAQTLFRDREGNIWAGGYDGLDRFVRSAIYVEPIAGRLLTGITPSRAPDGGIYVGSDVGAFEVGSGPARPIKIPYTIGAICAGPNKLLWVLTDNGTYREQNGKLSVVLQAGADQRIASATCVIDAGGKIWEGTSKLGISRYDNGAWRLASQWPARTFLADAGNGRLMAYQSKSGISLLDAGGEHVLLDPMKLTVGPIKLMEHVGNDWYFGGEAGVLRFDGRQFSRLSAARYPWLANTNGIAVQGQYAWIVSAAGIFRMLTADLNAAFARPGAPLSALRVGAAEGILGRPNIYTAADAKVDGLGRLWFATNVGLVRVDPTRLRQNSLPPPVAITRLDAGGRSFTGANADLPAGTTQVRFEFAALSLTNAQQNRFRYRLSGVDGDWVDAGSRREASYTELSPGTYRFEVIAANADGIWNRDGRSATFTIAPYFWQTWWFKALLVICAILVAVAVVRWRWLVAARLVRQRIEDRHSERERIARELHDTLLQGFQGLVLRFQAMVEKLPSGDQTRDVLAKALDRADDVLAEGRDRVRELRAPTDRVDLAAHLSAAAREIVVAPVRLEMKETGRTRPLSYPIADNIAQIVSEALANAMRHAGAREVEIFVEFGARRLVVVVSDDGAGLPAAILRDGKRDGHYGLVGMQERSAQLRAELVVGNGPNGGARIELTIPARVAYA